VRSRRSYKGVYNSDEDVEEANAKATNGKAPNGAAAAPGSPTHGGVGSPTAQPRFSYLGCGFARCACPGEPPELLRSRGARSAPLRSSAPPDQPVSFEHSSPLADRPTHVFELCGCLMYRAKLYGRYNGAAAALRRDPGPAHPPGHLALQRVAAMHVSSDLCVAEGRGEPTPRPAGAPQVPAAGRARAAGRAPEPASSVRARAPRRAVAWNMLSQASLLTAGEGPCWWRV